MLRSGLPPGCSGFCRCCKREHSLPVKPAYQAGLALMAELEAERRIDLQLSAEEADPCLSTGYLFGPAKGKMFGVLVAMAPNGRRVILRAFSGQYNGFWEVPGWVSPIFDLDVFHRVHDGEERKIKELGRQVEEQVTGSHHRQKLVALRKQTSQQLMVNIHNLYRLKNFAGKQASLHEIFPPGMGIPTGTGDCCAPKLLQYAAEHDLVPLAMAEFYWGLPNSSGTRQQGKFYPSCRAKCHPILGFMLFGLEKNNL